MENFEWMDEHTIAVYKITNNLMQNKHILCNDKEKDYIDIYLYNMQDIIDCNRKFGEHNK